MRLLIAVLLSAALIWSVQQETPVHKSFAERASTPRVTVATKTSTPTETGQQDGREQKQPETPAPVATPEPELPPAPTTHDELMAAAGISPADYGAVDYIITRESGWNADATNASSGAHGLPQALPYSKTGCGWVDAVCQLSWANTYAISRYGGWSSAQAYWALHGNW